MGKSTRNYPGQRSSNGYGHNDLRGSRRDTRHYMHPDDDPFRDLRAIADDMMDPVNDDCVWPEFENDDDD
jgi:hypothetical protein